MAEFYGMEFQISVQKRMQERQSWFDATPGAANGGRLLNFPDPEAVGWERIAELFAQDSVLSLTAQPLDRILPIVTELFGTDRSYPIWDVFFGNASEVTAKCGAVIKGIPIVSGWRLECFTTPDDDLIEQVQVLNMATGVAPYPAFYMRGEATPCMTSCLWDAHGTLVATASASFRYHPEGRLADYAFNGSISVSPDNRGQGLAKLVNAAVLLESQKAFNWINCLAQVQADNIASRKMIEACGMRMSDTLKTVAVIGSDAPFTR